MPANDLGKVDAGLPVKQGGFNEQFYLPLFLNHLKIAIEDIKGYKHMRAKGTLEHLTGDTVKTQKEGMQMR